MDKLPFNNKIKTNKKKMSMWSRVPQSSRVNLREESVDWFDNMKIIVDFTASPFPWVEL